MNYETPGATREAILSAATHMMNEVGPGGLRVAEVARAAGMTTGAIYAHFVDRQDLISAVRAAQVRESHAEMKDHSSDRLQRLSELLTAAEPLSSSKSYREFLMRTIIGEDKAPAWNWVKNEANLLMLSVQALGLVISWLLLPTLLLLSSWAILAQVLNLIVPMLTDKTLYQVLS